MTVADLVRRPRQPSSGRIWVATCARLRPEDKREGREITPSRSHGQSVADCRATVVGTPNAR